MKLQIHSRPKPGFRALVNGTLRAHSARGAYARRTRVRRALGVGLCLWMVLAQTSCIYGFTGGGFDPEIKTIFIQPFDNETVQFELDQQLFSKLQERVPRGLGIRFANEQNADAILTGKITRYEDAAQNYRPGGGSQTGVEVLQHQVQITISIRIVDRRPNKNIILWESTTLTGRGEYRPATQTDVEARNQAINHIVQQIIDGAQSQW